MALRDNLRKAIRNGESLAKDCRAYAQEAGNNPAAKIFMKMSDNINACLQELRNELRKSCGP